MFQIAAYRGIKAILKGNPVFWDNGQARGTKTLYKSPSVLIEPKKAPSKILYFGKIAADRDYNVKITVITPAPFSDQDNDVQDAQLLAHRAKQIEILTLLTDVEIKDEKGRLILSALEWVGHVGPTFNGVNAFTEFTYKCEAYDYTLCPEEMAVDAGLIISDANED